MLASRSRRFRFPLVALLAAWMIVSHPVRAEEEGAPAGGEAAQSTEQGASTPAEAQEEDLPPPTVKPPKRKTKAKRSGKRNYLTDAPGRVDAGIFHVGFAVGGNLYIEPQLDPKTAQPIGDYFRDFGFQAGVYFDYDYSEADANIPLALRGMVGYKYILNSVHVFTLDAVARRMIRLSESSSLGLGGGASAAVWYRAVTDSSPTSQVLFLPSIIATAGFDFNPFMVDIKWLINRIGGDTTIMGWELYFGFRL